MSGNKTLRRNINSKKKKLRQFFLFVIHKTLNIYEESMIQTEHNYLICGQFRSP